MIRRHRHVFGNGGAKIPRKFLETGAISAWQNGAQPRNKEIQKETGAETSEGSFFTGWRVPRLAATLEGFQLTRKRSRIGFDWEMRAALRKDAGKKPKS